MSVLKTGSAQKTGVGALFTGGLAAILASTCCLGPLLLVTLGFSGAWIGKLRVLEPYSHYFMAMALIAMYFAYRRIYRPQQDCKAGEVCAIPQVRIAYKIIFWLVVALILIGMAYPYILPYLF
ncbi:MAG: mercuric ion transporter MerT [Gallionellaceae bacterium]|jgi:mercuric ion transport protein